MAASSAQTAPQPNQDLMALRFEHEALSQQACQLASTLSRRRADLALIRAEAATVALSLESAKHRLDSALRAESSIRASAPPSPSPTSTAGSGIPSISLGGGRINSGRSAEDSSDETVAKGDSDKSSGSQTRVDALKRADFLPDDGLIRALSGQLEVTRKSVQQAEQRKAALTKEISKLKARVLEDAQRNFRDDSEHDCDHSNIRKLNVDKSSSRSTTAVVESRKNEVPTPVVARNVGFQPSDGLPKLKIDITTPLTQSSTISPPSPSQEGKWEERRRQSLTSVERSILQVLNDGATSHSSFRSDHARIWRDSTMPNLLLVDDAQQFYKLGVVTERIFEGITCFTQTFSKSAMIDVRMAVNSDIDSTVSDHGHQMSTKLDGVLRAKVVDQYASLCSVSHNDEHNQLDGRLVARIVAPRVALERVRKLASDASRRSSARVRTHDMDSSEFGTVTKQLIADVSSVAVSPPSLYSNTVGTEQTKGSEVDGKSTDDLGSSNGNSDGDAKSGENKLNESQSKDSDKSRDDTPQKGKEEAEDDAAGEGGEEEEEEKPSFPLPKRSGSSSVLSDEDFAALVGLGVPARFHECTLRLLYSTEIHGMSLRTLYNRCRTASPTVVAIRDTIGRSFGCYAAQPWRASATRYYGTGESFVFGVEEKKHKGGKKSRHMRVFKWSRGNSLFQFTSGSFLAIGGGAGSHFALWVDEDLLMGTTSTCSTFNSPPLTHTHLGEQSFKKDSAGKKKDDAGHKTLTEQSTEFNILVFEVWGLVTGRV